MKQFFNKGLCFLVLGLLLLQGCTKKPELTIDDIEIVDEPAILNEKISALIPHVYINVEDKAEVLEKSIYLQAELSIDGNDKFPTTTKLATTIKGRGNSTWLFPKKPYRLKLDKKSSLLGLPAAKNWVLLANYQDYSLMTNAIAMQIGKQLGMPYTPDIIPVDLTVNGVYRGSYNLTQQVEVNENRVNVGDDGILWELDSYFDEEWQFRSSNYDLPVMVKDPKIVSDSHFNTWKSNFEIFESAIADRSFPNNSYADLFDRQQFVNFLIVNMLVGNQEILHPKSVFMHRKVGGKYTMGPLWDFDYGFGFSEDHSQTYFNYADLPFFKASDNKVGTLFFKRLLTDPAIRSLFVNTWKDYKATKFGDLMEFIEVYASQIRESQKKDYTKWKLGNNKHAQNKADIKTFLRKRVLVVDKFVASF